MLIVTCEMNVKTMSAQFDNFEELRLKSKQIINKMEELLVNE